MSETMNGYMGDMDDIDRDETMELQGFVPKEPSSEELEKSRQRYRERLELYKKFGYDREKAIEFVVDSAEPIEEPVLDVGTGSGLTAVELARRGHHVTSVDISDDALQTAYVNAKAAQVADRIAFKLIDGMSLPFEARHFKLVTMVNVLHHLEEFVPLLREISRVLSPEGKLLVADFTEEGFDIIERVLRSEGNDHSRGGGHTIDDVAEVIHKHGMQCKLRDARFHEQVLVALKVSH
ncbi:MAG: hypothetical protein B6D63_04325 [Candidatus Latescibacteria bacterium 4484_7]|nr:MAG: hypothetical protein B6D63_04325 [Candidatus Latescibacteria bacterium 4484_7]